MAFKDTIKRKFSEGKTAFLQKRAATASIRKEATAAGLRERRTQSIRVATEKEKIRADRQIKAARTGGGGFAGFQSAMGALAGTPQRAAPMSSGAKRYKTTYVKKGKHYVQKRVAVTQRVASNVAPQRNNIDQLGSLLGGRSNGNGKKSSIYNIRI